MTWDVAIVPQVRDWLLELRQDDPAALAAVSAALDQLGKDGPALGPPLVSAIASMTAIHAGLELLRECDPGFQSSPDNVERTVAGSGLRVAMPSPSPYPERQPEDRPYCPMPRPPRLTAVRGSGYAANLA